MKACPTRKHINAGANFSQMAQDIAPLDPNDEIFKVLRPGVAVDVVVLTVLHDDLKVGLIRREDEPYFGRHALPGRFVRYEEKIEDTARKALETKGHINADSIYLEQLYTFGQNLVRDTRIRTISIVYYALINPEAITSQPGNTFIWESAYALPPLAFDHGEIISFTIGRIREKVLRSDIIFRFMPGEFTLSELQKACEIVLGRALDKRNFRKKAQEVFVLKDLKRTRMEGAHRPAKLYSFVKMREE